MKDVSDNVRCKKILLLVLFRCTAEESPICVNAKHLQIQHKNWNKCRHYQISKQTWPWYTGHFLYALILKQTTNVWQTCNVFGQISMELLFKFPLIVTFWRQLKFSLNSITPFPLLHSCIWKQFPGSFTAKKQLHLCKQCWFFRLHPICPQFQFVNGIAKACIDRANSHDQTNSSVELKQWNKHSVAQKRFGPNCFFLELLRTWWKKSYNLCI